jgi:hypothetical protein
MPLSNPLKVLYSPVGGDDSRSLLTDSEPDRPDDGHGGKPRDLRLVMPLASSLTMRRWRSASRQEWRKRVGIEPTAPGVSPEPDGFEGRAGHQTRIASERMMPRARGRA